MKWLLEAVAGRARVLSPVFAALLVLAAGFAQAQNTNFTCDTPPMGGTAAHEIQIIVGSMPPKIGIGALGSVVCNATVGIQIFDVEDLGGAPVASLAGTALPSGGKAMLSHVFEPGGTQRQNVVARITVTPEPSVGTSFHVWTEMCSVVGSAQVIDSASGTILGLDTMQDGETCGI